MSVNDPPQYRQSVDESVYVSQAQMVPGLRGRARTMRHYPDYLTERPLGPIAELNKGYPWSFLPHAIRSYVPGTQSVTIVRGGGIVQTFRFQAQAVQEIGVLPCS